MGGIAGAGMSTSQIDKLQRIADELEALPGTFAADGPEYATDEEVTFLTREAGELIAKAADAGGFSDRRFVELRLHIRKIQDGTHPWFQEEDCPGIERGTRVWRTVGHWLDEKRWPGWELGLWSNNPWAACQAIAKLIREPHAGLTAGKAVRPVNNGSRHAAEGRTENGTAREPVYQSKMVKLFGLREEPEVCGKRKPPLREERYDVVRALIEAGDAGLTKDQLDRNSGHSDARKLMQRLANKDADWNQVLHLPGAPGRGGYRIS